jgi:hypothetical protein
VSASPGVDVIILKLDERIRHNDAEPRGLWHGSIAEAAEREHHT